MNPRHLVPTLALTLAFAVGSSTLAIADGENNNNQNHQQSGDHKDGDHKDGDHKDGDHKDGDHNRDDDHFSVCHHEGSRGGHTIDVDHHGIPGHLAHGDQLGSCPVSGSR